jgi:hypothetical protein
MIGDDPPAPVPDVMAMVKSRKAEQVRVWGVWGWG